MKILKIIFVPVALVLFMLLFCVAGMYTFSYQESMGTFYYNEAFVSGTLWRPGGLAKLISAWLTQFFVNPMAGVALISAVLTAIAGVTGSIIERVSGRWSLAPLGILPAVFVAYLNYNTGYSNAGTIALLLMVCALVLMLKADSSERIPLWTKAVVAVALTLLLSYLAGAVALLFGALLCVATVVKSPRRAALYLMSPIAAWLMGVFYVRMGYFGDLGRVLTPEMYYTLRLQAPSFVYMPWYTMAGVIAVAAVAAMVKKQDTSKSAKIVWGICLAAPVVFAFIGIRNFVDRDNERFKQLMYYSGRGDWQAMIDMCEGLPMQNLLMQNCLNMALAEEGRLADELFHYPVYDIRSIYIEGEKNPYMQTLLSDIYYSMGHIALAQRNAFEANESLDNLSPRLLRRLVQTNLAFGAHPVAEKYLRLLEDTKYYADDAARYRRLLYNDAAVAADPELGPKRACIFPDNRFSAYRGLDDDLRQVLRANPGHKATLQYLGSLYLLSKDTESFAGVVDEFYGADSIAVPLPKAYAEAMVAYHGEKADSVAARYNIPQETVQLFKNMMNGGNTPPETFWHFFKYVR